MQAKYQHFAAIQGYESRVSLRLVPPALVVDIPSRQRSTGVLGIMEKSGCPISIGRTFDTGPLFLFATSCRCDTHTARTAEVPYAFVSRDLDFPRRHAQATRVLYQAGCWTSFPTSCCVRSLCRLCEIAGEEMLVVWVDYASQGEHSILSAHIAKSLRFSTPAIALAVCVCLCQLDSYHS